jgi:hypothetical protein
MADQIAISGEFCTLLAESKALAATKNFSFKVDRATYGNFVARGTSKFESNYPAAIAASLDVDGLIVLVDPSPDAHGFDDLFTYLINGTRLTLVFTLRTSTTGEKTFIYTGEAYLKSLSASAPQFGEATYQASLVFTGTITQTTGIVS